MTRMIRMRNDIHTVFPNQLSDNIEQLLHSTAVEECWRKGKDELLVSRDYSKFRNLKKTIVL
jgi:hypothetical protein